MPARPGVRALAVDESGAVIDVSYRELTQHYPRPGWVEHDPAEIWDVGARPRVVEVAGRLHEAGDAVAAIGITNQRETVVAWDRADGRPLHRAIVWQDRRTAERCDQLRADGHLPVGAGPHRPRARPLLLGHQDGVAARAGGRRGHRRPRAGDRRHLADLEPHRRHPTAGSSPPTPPTRRAPCSATSATRAWSDELCDIFGVPLRRAARGASVVRALRRPCAGRSAEQAPSLAGVPVSGVAGDQQAALFGQACLAPGMAKVTYGTGSFVLLNVGARVPAAVGGPAHHRGLGPGRARRRRHRSPTPSRGRCSSPARRSSGCATGWGSSTRRPASGPWPSQVADSEGVFVVPAFTGLGSPWWDPYARGTITGLTRGVGARPHRPRRGRGHRRTRCATWWTP